MFSRFIAFWHLGVFIWGFHFNLSTNASKKGRWCWPQFLWWHAEACCVWAYIFIAEGLDIFNILRILQLTDLLPSSFTNLHSFFDVHKFFKWFSNGVWSRKFWVLSIDQLFVGSLWNNWGTYNISLTPFQNHFEFLGSLFKFLSQCSKV